MTSVREELLSLVTGSLYGYGLTDIESISETVVDELLAAGYTRG